MNVSGCDEDFCWYCSSPGSCCHREFPDSPWSKSTPQSSFCTFDGRDQRANFDVDEPAFCTIDGSYFLPSAFESPDLEIIDPGRRPQHALAASTAKNNEDVETWESPGAMPPPESSSPLCFNADSFPFATGVDLPARMSCHVGDAAVDQPLLYHSLDDSSQRRIKASFNHCPDLSSPTLSTTTSRFDHRSTDSSIPTQEFPDARPCATRRHAVAGAHDVCVVTGRTIIERSKDLGKQDETLNFTISTELEPPSLSCGSENDGPYDATTSSSEARSDYGTPSKIPSRGVSLDSVSSPVQATVDNYLKRRRSSVDYFPESKKVKHDRTESFVSCVSNVDIRSKYNATEPASFRRAESLTSEVSACSGQSTDSLFDHLLSPLISRPFQDEEYPPTIPSTPLPNSVDYALSRANPLSRTLAVYRRRSLEIPAIPDVPIIAPPRLLLPTAVYCAEDHAIDRLEALLLKESLERARDGLNVHDRHRAARLEALHRTDLSLPRRDSGSTSDSSDNYDQWEEETTLSETESQESQDSAPRMKIQLLAEQYRLASRETWTNAYGITDDFRKEITRWILEKVPDEPVPVPGKLFERPPGTDLYDQLTNSSQTRFHAAHMFHRYFCLPEKVEYWRETYKYECWRSRDVSGYHCDVWDVAVACMALSVKLHRDCLKPLLPVFAAEFLAIAPQLMSHETLELVQRDVLYSFQFQLGTCTPQDVLDELWNALPTLRKASATISWAVVQRVTWEKLFESLLEPDMLQYPVTLLTAAALVDGLTFALASHYSIEAEVRACKCKALAEDLVPECIPDEIESTLWQIHLHEASNLVNDVISDVRDVLHLAPVELDECRKWLNHVGQA